MSFTLHVLLFAAILCGWFETTEKMSALLFHMGTAAETNKITDDNEKPR